MNTKGIVIPHIEEDGWESETRAGLHFSKADDKSYFIEMFDCEKSLRLRVAKEDLKNVMQFLGLLPANLICDLGATA